MPELLADLLVSDLAMLLVSEEFVPPDDWRAQIALPAGILILLGGVFMLVRSNLGTRRGYLVMANAFFGFMLLISLFWTFGAPGTPPLTGPQNLPGQPLDYYQPKWVPFAEDSLAAERSDFSVVQDYPQGWSEQAPAEVDEDMLEEAIDDIRGFFASEEGGQRVGETWVPNEEETPVLYAEDANGRPMVAIEFVQADALGQIEDPDNTFMTFAFFDAGAPAFPSYVMIALSGLGLLLHMVLLGWDERKERRELEEDLGRESEQEKVPAGV